MTPAELATAAAISFECKKDSMRQNQSGDWKIAFTVQGIDVPDRLTKAFPGTRFMMVLVEIGGDELPVQPAPVAQPEPVDQPRPARAKRDWRDLQPSQQAGIRCQEPEFKAFLREQRSAEWKDTVFAADDTVRYICGVSSRRDLNTSHKARVIWHQLNDQYEAWMRVGA